MKRRSKPDEMAQAVGDYPALYKLHEWQGDRQPAQSKSHWRVGKRGTARLRVLLKVGASLATVIALGLIVSADLTALSAPASLHEAMAKAGLGQLER